MLIIFSDLNSSAAVQGRYKSVTLNACSSIKHEHVIMLIMI